MVTVGTGRKSVRPRMSRSLHDRTETARLLDRLVAVHVGDVVLADDDLGVDAGSIDRTEDLDDATERRTARRRPAGELRDHHRARLRVSCVGGGHLHVGEEPLVEGHDEAEAGVVQVEASNNRRVRALEDADDPALDAVGLLPLDAHDDAVAMQRFLEVGRRHVHVGLTPHDRYRG